jgi:hypothetical protein
LQHLVEGNTLRSTARLSGVHRTTIMNLMVEFGRRCKTFMDARLRGLTLEHVEVDRIWTFVANKQGPLTPEDKATCHDIGKSTCGRPSTRKPSWWPPTSLASGRPTTPGD